MMFKNKKGDLSINLIIVAAIAMIVLLVVVLIFTGRFGEFNKNTKACLANGGTCLERNQVCDTAVVDGTCPGGDNEVGTLDDGICCLRV